MAPKGEIPPVRNILKQAKENCQDVDNLVGTMGNHTVYSTTNVIDNDPEEAKHVGFSHGYDSDQYQNGKSGIKVGNSREVKRI